MTTDRTSALHDLLSTRILVLDGAMGTMIQRHKLTEEDFRGARFADPRPRPQGRQRRPGPDPAGRHCRAFTASTSRPAATSSRPTASTATLSLRPTTASRHSCYELNLEGAKLARAAADEYTAKTPDQPRFVAGSMGPTNRILSISPDVNNPAFRNMTFDQLRDAFKEQVRGLIDGGCDLLLLETIVDTLNAKAGIVAIEEVFDEKGRTAAADDFSDGHRPQRSHPVRPDHRRVLGVHRAMPGRSASA